MDTLKSGGIEALREAMASKANDPDTKCLVVRQRHTGKIWHPHVKKAMIIAFALIAVAVLTVASLISEPATIEGIVRDQNGVAVDGASVAIEGTAVSTFTSSDGRFILADVPAGHRWVLIELPGESGVAVPVQANRGGRHTLRSLTLYRHHSGQ